MDKDILDRLTVGKAYNGLYYIKVRGSFEKRDYEMAELLDMGLNIYQNLLLNNGGITFEDFLKSSPECKIKFKKEIGFEDKKNAEKAIECIRNMGKNSFRNMCKSYRKIVQTYIINENIECDLNRKQQMVAIRDKTDGQADMVVISVEELEQIMKVVKEEN